MTHVVRISERRKANERKLKSAAYEVLDSVTLIECPPVVIFGIVGYKKTITGLQRSTVLVAKNISEGVIRRYNKYYSKCKSYNPLHRYTDRYQDDNPSLIEEDIASLKECDSIRVLVQSQTEKIPALNTKRVHVNEIQVNGGKSVAEKVEWALERMEKEIPVRQVFSEQENIDIIAVTKGKGFQGCPKRWGTTILPRKSNKGKRKVACIGAWHPSRVMWTVPRAGQMGFHRRTETNKRIYKIGHGQEQTTTEWDITPKTINPIGGFKHYGDIKNEYIMIKGSVPGSRRRVITLRKSLNNNFSSKNTEDIVLKFFDTSSKVGAGRFQTVEEKNAFYGLRKKKVTEISEQL